mgnify:CR=1 FL=1
MKITKELLKEKGACVDGYRAFLEEYPEKKFPDGVEYQELLDICAEKSWEYGTWLLNKFGPTDEIREIEGDLIAEGSIIFAGQIKVSGSIEAGGGIKAGWGIEAGKDFGIYAGLSCKITDHKYRKIIASEEPENIMCGEFKEKSV